MVSRCLKCFAGASFVRGVCLCTREHVRVHACACVCEQESVCLRVCVFVLACMCVCVCVCVFVRGYVTYHNNCQNNVQFVVLKA